MSRLAAYYQEDFQYHPINHTPKQRKSTYVFYEEPHNGFQNYALNSDRLRSLAISEPSLVPVPHTCKLNKMTLKNKPILYGSQLIENPHPAMQYFDNHQNLHYSPNQYSRHQEGMYDNESLYPSERMFYDDRFISRHERVPKDKAHKRLSYVEPRNNNYSSDAHAHHNYNKYHPQKQVDVDLNNYDNRNQHIPRDYYYESSQGSLSPRSPVYYHNGHWQQWPLDSDETFINRGLLSPPSPLDSGLSSQSITSSPSLEADSFPSHRESITDRSCRDSICLCRNTQYIDAKHHGPNLSRHDSGRSSGVYSAYGYSKEPLHLKNNIKHASHVKDDVNYNGHHGGNVRYGKLGLIGEPVHNASTINNVSRKNKEKSSRHEHKRLESMYESSLETDNDTEIRKTSSRSAKSSHHQKYEKPFVVITEASEKSTESEDAMSPEMEMSEKSDDLESTSSATVSSSKASSVSSSDNDFNCNRKKNRTTEKEIRELEDMYEKCNLSDADLLDRAERRDLPTAHQAKRDQINVRLKRSKSDTLYETIGPTFRNPYEIPQRAPPYRRSGLPDRIADDMALRKLRKATTTSSKEDSKNTITYMLCNSHFTPTVPGCKDILLLGYPDVEFDDLSYRKHYFGKKTKIPDPQPPFGIPLRPPPPQKVFTDYLHVVPSDIPQPLCHPRGNPDVVRDDLAFRALRKEEPERMYYDISQLYKIRKC